MAENFYKRLSRAKKYILVDRRGRIEEVALMPLKRKRKRRSRYAKR